MGQQGPFLQDKIHSLFCDIGNNFTKCDIDLRGCVKKTQDSHMGLES